MRCKILLSFAIMMFAISSGVLAQNAARTITGKVTDEKRASPLRILALHWIALLWERRPTPKVFTPLHLLKKPNA
ncbi:hypothetical protein [Niabella ginsengisoli]|uniref:Uncharacterized protein n=1 Tax=Niabella ginsengisoli TaxID=522298 RepID=A0ABS9SN65_9BACT|nr:hypothetical protein [Niabella ginsengisoli]MCH5599802.1 hypothetical protein [Niabella ginsengisoli]